MAFGMARKTPKDIAVSDEMWKRSVRKEDDSEYTWRKTWGWLLDEYSCLHKKLKEKSDSSEFLGTVKQEEKEDERKLTRVPLLTNHQYGWIPEQKDFALEKFGSDFFKPLPLPDLYQLVK